MNYYVSQYKVSAPLATMSMEVMTKIVNHYKDRPHLEVATAAELGASGSFMTSLVRRGYAVAAGKRENGFQYAGNGLYRKLEVNEYHLLVPAEWLWHDYVLSMKEVATAKKNAAIVCLDEAQQKLQDAREMLEKVESVHF